MRGRLLVAYLYAGYLVWVFARPDVSPEIDRWVSWLLGCLVGYYWCRLCSEGRSAKA